MRSEIILIVLFAFSVFLLLANFRICGIVGDTVSGFFFGIIGFSEYIFPVYLFVSAAYLISNDFRGKIVKKVVYFGVVLILLSMVFQAIYSSTFESVKVLYMDGYKDRSGGGVICGGIFFAIRTLLGVPGACIVIFIAAVIMFILITEISVIDEIKLFIASIRERRESDDDEQYEDEEYQSDRYDDGYYSHDVNDTPVRRVRPSMANLNVYSSDKSKDDRASDRTAATQVKPRKTKIQKDVEREPARDFFAMEDVHELTPGDGAVDMSYDEFNNDIEKIVMTDREEIVNPVQIDREDPVHKPVRKPAPVKRRKPVVVTPEEPKLAAVDTDMEDAEILSFTDDAEDVLAGAVNGNMHPESVSDYNPLYDSAFAEEEKTDTAAQSKRSRRYRLRAQSSIRREENINSQRQICCPSLKRRTIPTGMPMSGRQPSSLRIPSRHLASM
ncbi:MAG: DNA translocase FtsK 4TM domain-containing protein [Coprococcus sp.]